MSLRLERVGYTYSQDTGFATRALDDVSLEVEVGELVLILGATGSGKSTLLRVAAGLLEPQQGCATIEGEPLTRQTARGNVGLVFQDAEAALFADTVLDDVAFGPKNLGISGEESIARARAALLAVGLDPGAFGDRSPFSLSGGEARRAAIAGVLAMRPRYLLADEPTAGLDSAGRSALKRLVLDARERAGLVVVSHTAEEFLGHADRVMVLSAGAVKRYGPGDELIADPSGLDEAGLAAPVLLEVQLQARRKGLDVGEFTLDALVAAERIAAAGGWS